MNDNTIQKINLRTLESSKPITFLIVCMTLLITRVHKEDEDWFRKNTLSVFLLFLLFFSPFFPILSNLAHISSGILRPFIQLQLVSMVSVLLMILIFCSIVAVVFVTVNNNYSIKQYDDFSKTNVFRWTDILSLTDVSKNMKMYLLFTFIMFIVVSLPLLMPSMIVFYMMSFILFIVFSFYDLIITHCEIKIMKECDNAFANIDTIIPIGAVLTLQYLLHNITGYQDIGTIIVCSILYIKSMYVFITPIKMFIKMVST